ncbi:MAG TPA: DNA translocase FtsK 4TM domain-containing protein, partial [Reyranellaceae bacterium]|nr:DNA translocase FtsK 4TM domain-containing protein [Reyranellaceae bacterium]
MALIGATSAPRARPAFLPEGGRDFLRRRLMELVGVVVAASGVCLLAALFTYSPLDPSLNHATARTPHNLMGTLGAYTSDLLLQTFGLAIFLAPVAMITWGVRMVRTHHLGFFGLRLSLLLLALLLMSVACIGMGNVGEAATHAGAGGLVGHALVGRLRELVLTHSSGGSIGLIEPICAALAFIAMAPALGMNRTDLPLIFRILRAPFLWGLWLVRAAVGLWRGKPQPLDEALEPPGPSIGYAEIPGEIDALQYSPTPFEHIPESGAPLPPRDSLLVDAPYAPIERPAPEIPESPVTLNPQAPPVATDLQPGSMQERTLFDRLSGLRIEPILGKLRPAAEPVEPVAAADVAPAQPIDDPNPFTPDALPADPAPAAASGPKIVTRKSSAAQGKRAARAGQRELDLGGGEYQLPPLDILSLPSRVTTEIKIDEEALEQNARLLETVLEYFGVKGQIVKVRPGPVVT